VDRVVGVAGFLPPPEVMRDLTETNRLTEERDCFFSLSIDILCVVHLDGEDLVSTAAGYEIREWRADDLGFELIRDRPNTKA